MILYLEHLSESSDLQGATCLARFQSPEHRDIDEEYFYGNFPNQDI